jgi:hypothetical protein
MSTSTIKRDIKFSQAISTVSDLLRNCKYHDKGELRSACELVAEHCTDGIEAVVNAGDLEEYFLAEWQMTTAKLS